MRAPLPQAVFGGGLRGDDRGGDPPGYPSAISFSVARLYFVDGDGSGGYLPRSRPFAGPPRLGALPIEPIAQHDPPPTDKPAATDEPLVTPADWPGVDVSYRFRMTEVSGAPKQPVLTLHLAFDPGQVVRDADDGGVKTALERYARIAAQLADRRVALSMDMTVLPGDAARVASTDELRPALAAFVDVAVAELCTAAGGGTPNRVVSDGSFR